MKLSNLELTSKLRLTQPNVDDESQTLDIEFDVTKSATISNELFSLAFYNMLNGYSTGVDGTPTCGFKFTAYDTDDNMIMESVPAKIDMVMDEAYTRLESNSETVVADATTDVFLSKLVISYVGNDDDAEVEFMVLESMAPKVVVFAEEVPASDPVMKGIKIMGGADTKFIASVTLFWKT